MKDFKSFIKNYSTKEFIRFFSTISIEMFKRQRPENNLGYWTTFPLSVVKYGFIHENVEIKLSAWDIPDMAYLSIINSNDYRREVITEQIIGRLVNLYRIYDDERSKDEHPENSSLTDIFKMFFGMTYEQFKSQNFEWIYRNFNRNYHILVGSCDINRNKIIDINEITNELFGLNVEELLVLEWVIWWLCYHYQTPTPLSVPEKFYNERVGSIINKKNIEKIIKYYSVSYEDVRKSPLGKQIFYQKPFVITQKKKEMIAVSFYVVYMLLADGLYWLIRDYYLKKDMGQKFINAFGEMFESYFEELAKFYLPKDTWYKIPESNIKSADYYVEMPDNIFLFELKSVLLGINAKQQMPDVKTVDIFYQRAIKKAYKQLVSSENEYTGNKPVIKVFLLYETLANSQMIAASLPEIFENGKKCYIMTIEDLEMLWTTYKNDKIKFGKIIDVLLQNHEKQKIYTSVCNILNKYQATEEDYFTDERDYYKEIVQKIEIL